MRNILFFFLTVFTCALMVNPSQGQNHIRAEEPSPRTILWKITGGNCPSPSYILGTFHLTEADWLLKYPQMKKVIDSTSFILTEPYTTIPAPVTKKQGALKALPLLDQRQFDYLDSFFVARVGEGIRNNRDAEEMTVAEMEGGILETLVYGSSKANGITKLMDKDLFDLYVKLGREGDRLDRIPTSDFDSSEIVHAKQYLTHALKYIENSDKPDWNIYRTAGVEDAISDYKNMKMKYLFDEHPASTPHPDDFNFVPVEQRNKNWIPKIIDQISRKPCLIAVGLGHLYYKTGIIMLLKAQGYQVEQVVLDKP